MGDVGVGKWWAVAVAAAVVVIGVLVASFISFPEVICSKLPETPSGCPQPSHLAARAEIVLAAAVAAVVVYVLLRALQSRAASRALQDPN